MNNLGETIIPIVAILIIILGLSTASLFGKIYRRYEELNKNKSKFEVFIEMNYFLHIVWLFGAGKTPKDKIIQEALSRERKVWLIIVVLFIIAIVLATIP